MALALLAQIFNAYLNLLHVSVLFFLFIFLLTTYICALGVFYRRDMEIYRVQKVLYIV